jgi:hypothetical protein
MAFIFKTLNVRGLPSFHLIDLFEKYWLLLKSTAKERKEGRKEGRRGWREKGGKGRREGLFL